MNKKLLVSGMIFLFLSVGLSGSIKTEFKKSVNEDCNYEDCVGLVATGPCVKDNLSIFWKNRHDSASYQKPIFFQGTNYSYFGVGNAGSPSGECRMGMNEKGLAIGNFVVSGDTITNWEYTSDEIANSSDDNMMIPLSNFSTVYAAAMWIALHGYYGDTWGFQFGIVSAEEGVGAIVAIDYLGHSNITWVNNTYAVVANAFYCDGDTDPDGTDKRAKQIIDDIVDNCTSSDGDCLINWKDVCQRLAKDTSDKEDGDDTFSYYGEISGSTAHSAMIAVSGNSSYNNSIHMTWLNIGKTTQIGIFLPLSASCLKSSGDIPFNFTNGNGIQQYVDVKYIYASAGANQYYCDRVREIQDYAFYNENLTFDWFDDLMDTIMNCADEEEVKSRIKSYVENSVDTALYGYINNLSTPIVDIVKPEKALYINNKKIIPFLLFLPPIIFKNIDIEATVSRGSIGVDRVEFYIDDQYKANGTTPPYTWMWDEKTPLKFRHIVRVTAYDDAGYTSDDELIVWKFL